MTAQSHKEVIRRLVEDILNAGDLARAADVISDNFVDHNPSLPGQAPGPDGFRVVNEMLRSAFPDLTLTIEDMIADDDKVAVRFSARGTHHGVFAGVPPTGRQVAWEVISLIRITNGKIAERWSQADTPGLMGQLQDTAS